MTTDTQGSTLFTQEDWKPNRHHGLSRRVASLLSWMAQRRPGVFLSYAEIARRVLGLQTKLGPSSKLTAAVKEEIFRSRELLAKLHGRDLITNGRSARATVDGDELFRFRLGLDLARIVSQLARYGRTARMISDRGVDNPKMAAHARHAEELALTWAEPLRSLLSDWNTTVGAAPAEIIGYLDA